eukprot:TRINITY_DN9611_c0_g1_i5.p3 TRINITY_DN9611_c0_g1~~TRINITY_DN9611_c0_g1_i5.p3  ORF type:complete len:105 (+),score=27.19 TRINITY_DN9611_c0_g1_i5:543-857(+)
MLTVLGDSNVTAALQQARQHAQAAAQAAPLDPAARIEQQIKQRKQLWNSSTSAEEGEPTAEAAVPKAWQGTAFEGDQDGNRKAKFLKLMGAGTVVRGGILRVGE